MSTANNLSRVIDAAMGSYMHHGFSVTPVSEQDSMSYFDFFIPEKRRMEKVYSSKMLDIVNLNKYEEYRNKGFEIWILVPLSSMGRAHEAFRDRADWIQAWWIKDNRIKFSSPQRP